MRMLWTAEQEAFLREWYPHFAAAWVAEQLHLDFKQVRFKANKLKLKMLGRAERLCINRCGRTLVGTKRAHGFYCRVCFAARRSAARLGTEKNLKSRFREMLRSARSRSKQPCDLTVEDLTALWSTQGGKCAYSGLPMAFGRWGEGRTPLAPTLDQVQAGGGYTRGNVVLCAWVVNAAKNTLTVREYVEVCRAVVTYMDTNRHADVIAAWLDAQP